MDLLLILLAILPAVLGQYDSDCPMLLESELGDTTTPVNTGFLALALSTASGDDTLVVQLLEFNIVCLAQGTVNGTYRSLSLIAAYRDGGGTEEIAQLHLQCVNGNWSTNNFGNTDTAASNPSNGTLNTTMRTDCIICANPLQLGGEESAEHCRECDAGCVGLERCIGTDINNQTCCNYFDTTGSCVTACPADSTPNAEFLCVMNNPCDPNPCGNGTCTAMGNTVSCDCDEGFEPSGDTCVEVIDRCDPNPCGNGTCTAMGNTVSCDCDEGFELSGNTCVEKEENRCVPNPCENGGTCKVMGDTFSCDCRESSKGITCSECNKGFSKSSSGSCTETTGLSSGAGIAIGVVIGAVAVIAIGLVIAHILIVQFRVKAIKV